MRVLIVGGGARGLALSRRLRSRGDAVRIVTRDPAKQAAIEATGAEFLLGDPDRVGTLRYACENVTALLWALGTASGDDPERVAALHGTRLQMMLERTIDTTVRAVLYEAAGSQPPEVFAAGREVVERMCRKNEIPFAIVDAGVDDADAWAATVERELLRLLELDRG
jgi:glycine/D-amino acid oxidase-like deaminating enzyme